MVTFALFVRPLLAALAGEKEWQLPVVLARLTEEFRHAPGLTRFLPAWLETAPSKAAGAGAFPYMPSITPVQWHGSGDLAASARANCYLVAPEDRPCLAAESCVPVLLR
jgi:molybdopterin molybdotransferase